MILALLLSILGAAGAAEPPARRDECQYLTAHVDTDGFTTDQRARDGDFDGSGNAFAADALPSDARLIVRSAVFGPIEFIRPRTDGAENNLIACRGQTIRVRTRRTFNVLFSLGAAHSGVASGWITFTFDDGTTARGPIGFTDWWDDPLLGEEIAFRLPVGGGRTVHPAGGAHIFLQRTPIPVEKRIVSLTLPNLPNAKIMALTFGWREGIEPIEEAGAPAPAEAPVAIFCEPGFPSYLTGGEVAVDRIRAAFERAELPFALLGLDHVKDPAILRPDAVPVLVNPYGNAFPADAEDNLRAYRKAGGAMVHRGVPFTHPVVRTSYGTWIDGDHTAVLMGHEGDRAMGTGAFATKAWRSLVPQPMLRDWGLGDVEWSRFGTWFDRVKPPPKDRQFLDPNSLSADDEMIPLLSIDPEGNDPFAAIIRHRTCAFAGAIDVWAGACAIGNAPQEVQAALVAEIIVRAAAWILREKGLIDEARWREIAKPVEPGLRVPEPIEPVWPDPAWSWHLPRAGRAGRRVHLIDVRPLADSERVMLASAQGLVNRAGGADATDGTDAADAIFLAEDDRAAELLKWYRQEGLIDDFRNALPRDALGLVGHRKAVVVDPDLYGSLNIATMIAGIDGLLIAYPRDVVDYDLSIAEDLRGRFASAAEAYAWAFETLWPRMSHQALALEEPRMRAWEARDYLVAHKIFPFWIPGLRDQIARGAGSEAEQEVVTRILARTPVCTAILATDRPLRHGVDDGWSTLFFSAFGKYRVRLWPRANLSFTSGIAVEVEGSAPRATPPAAVEPDKVYASCVYDPAAVPLSIIDPTQTEPVYWRRSTARDKGGAIFLPALADLLPGPTVRALSEGGIRECVGSRGLGDVDPEAFGGAFGDEAPRVRQLYFEIVDRSMKDLGQRFLFLDGWREPRGTAITECARFVPSAEAILPAFRSGARLDPVGAAYILDGRPVIHTLAPRNMTDFRADMLAAGAYAGIRPVFAWARGDPALLSTPLAPEAVLVSPADLGALLRARFASLPLEEARLIAPGSTWKYHDRGEDLGARWRSAAFDDAAWASGAAKLGYGDPIAAAATTISFGADPKAKHPCAYFRRTFSVAGAARIRHLFVELVRDDGCVIHLNGEEVARSNMPTGDIAFATFAASAVADAAETAWQILAVDPRRVREGENVIAVEVHQSDAGSSDLGFDLGLVGYLGPAPEPAPR
ncbi:MAG: hypothetical protein JXP34_23540 [Planctomycetes bacterium]|nr:hypothetical protein [Planctomycetota bacterium]